MKATAMTEAAFIYVSSPRAALAARRALGAQQQQQRPKGAWRLPALVPVALALLTLTFCFKIEYHGLVSVASRTRPASQGGLVLLPPPPSATFTCPDGRRGLHVVHTRFLCGQANATATFVNARLMLMNTFFAPSLAAQTAQSFVLLASFDPGLAVATRRALEQTLARLHVPALALAERHPGRSGNEAAVAYRRVVLLLRQRGVLPTNPDDADFDLFITSRMDLDDAVHVGAVEAVQRLACSRNGAAGGGDELLRVAYIKPGRLWLPASDRSPHGITSKVPGTSPFLAILQSMVLARPLLHCPLSVYSHEHTQPWRLQELGRRPAAGACAFRFDRRRHLHVWAPPEGQLGSLYVRTATSSTRGKDKTGARHGRVADPRQLAASFGLDPASVMMANLLLSGLEDEARGLLAVKNARDNKF